MVSKQEFITTFFRETDIPVAPSMERALGYFGVSRWVAFHQSRRLKGLCWTSLLGLILPALGLAYIGGWPLFGLAAGIILLPAAGYAPESIRPPKRSESPEHP